jgi:hypothetical protein
VAGSQDFAPHLSTSVSMVHSMHTLDSVSHMLVASR